MTENGAGVTVRGSGIDPLEPLIVAARALGILVFGLLLLSTLATVFGSGSVLTIGQDSICATVYAGQGPAVPSTDPVTGIAPGALAPRVGAVAEQYQLCQDRPDAATQVLGALTLLPEMLLLLGFLAGVFLLVRRARRCGLFSRPVVRVVHGLGWFVLAGALVAGVGQALAGAGLAQHLLPGTPMPDLTSYLQISVPALLAGAGILTVARVLRLTVRMQDDLDATI